MTKINIILPPKKGHYHDYAIFLKEILVSYDVRLISTKRDTIKKLLSLRQAIVFLDVESKSVAFWLIFRCLFSRKNFAISVATEILVQKKIDDPFQNIEKRYFVKRFVKYYFVKLMTRLKRLHIMSILKETDFDESVKDIVRFTTYDIQYYDLEYIKIQPHQVDELKSLTNQQKDSSIFILNNTGPSKKNIEKLKSWIESQPDLFFIIVGKADFIDTNRSNILHINRYVTNEELIYLIKESRIIYCFHSNNKPSGLMGRSMQLSKPILVPKNNYLSSINYINSIVLEELSDFSFDYLNIEIKNNPTNFDESEKIVQCFDKFS